MLLLACEGVIPRFDVALFADTGWEPRTVYTNLERLTAHAENNGIPVRRVSAGNIRTDALDSKHRFVSMPLHTLNRIASGVIERAVTGRDGYTARDVLAHAGCRDLLTGQQSRKLTELVKACELGSGTLPAVLLQDLTQALASAEKVISRNLPSSKATEPARSAPTYLLG